jgi:hypothetical protein
VEPVCAGKNILSNREEPAVGNAFLLISDAAESRAQLKFFPTHTPTHRAWCPA